MSSSVEIAKVEAPETPKGVKSSKPVKTKPTHPSTAKMVETAIAALNEKKGSTVQAIKKYVIATYLLDPVKANKVISKYLRTAATTGSLVQTKGIGASGSFKLPSKTTKGGTKKIAKKEERVRPTTKTPKKEVSGKDKKVKTIRTAAKPKAKKLGSSPVKTMKKSAKKPKVEYSRMSTGGRKE